MKLQWIFPVIFFNVFQKSNLLIWRWDFLISVQKYFNILQHLIIQQTSSQDHHLWRKKKYIWMHESVCAKKATSVVSDSLWLYGQQPSRLLCPWDSPSKNTGVDFHALLQEIFLTQGSKPTSPVWGWILYPLSHQESPHIYIYFPKTNMS